MAAAPHRDRTVILTALAVEVVVHRIPLSVMAAAVGVGVQHRRIINRITNRTHRLHIIGQNVTVAIRRLAVRRVAHTVVVDRMAVALELAVVGVEAVRTNPIRTTRTVLVLAVAAVVVVVVAVSASRTCNIAASHALDRAHRVVPRRNPHMVVVGVVAAHMVVIRTRIRAALPHPHPELHTALPDRAHRFDPVRVAAVLVVVVVVVPARAAAHRRVADSHRRHKYVNRMAGAGAHDRSSHTNSHSHLFGCLCSTRAVAVHIADAHLHRRRVTRRMAVRLHHQKPITTHRLRLNPRIRITRVHRRVGINTCSQHS